MLTRARLRRDQRFCLLGKRSYIISERANALCKQYLRVKERIKSGVCIAARLILPINAFFLDSGKLDKELVRLFQPRLARFKPNLGVYQRSQLFIRSPQRGVMSINALFLKPDELDDRLMRLGNLLNGLIEPLLPGLIFYLRFCKPRLVASHCL